MKVRSGLNPRKLLQATAGLAAVSYLGTTSCSTSSGNLSSGNLMAPATGGSEATTTDGDGSGGNFSSGNLVSPDYPVDCDDAMGGVGGVGGEGSSACDKIVR